MYTYIMRTCAAPGKLLEVVSLFKAWNEVVKRKTGEGMTVTTAVAGPFSEVVCIWQAESLDQAQEANVAMFADPEIREIYSKLGACVLPNGTTTSIHKHQN